LILLIEGKIMTIVKVLLCGILLVFILGCNTSNNAAIPATQEQYQGVYKIYSKRGMKSYEHGKARDENNTVCKLSLIGNNLKSDVIYIKILDSKYFKKLNVLDDKNEMAAIEKLDAQDKNSYRITKNNEFAFAEYTRAGASDFAMPRNKNGDFINSEFLTIKDGKIIAKMANFADRKVQIYDKNQTLLNKPYREIIGYQNSCKEAMVFEGFDVLSVPITAQIGTFKEEISSKQKEKPINNKFWISNANGKYGLVDHSKNIIVEPQNKYKFVGARR
jgi:major membrane immunogen (membrane-anchored lipoprotein)